MAYTTYATDQIGAFTEVDCGNTFEYSWNKEELPWRNGT